MMKTALRRGGFTLVELMVVMAITMFVLVAASRVMINMVSQFKTQSKIAETSLESNFGMEVLRKDLSRAGYGLPYAIAVAGSDNNYKELDWSPLTDYKEIESGATGCTQCPKAVTFNDSTAAGKTPPRFVLVGNPGGTVNGSDYFVIKGLLTDTNSSAAGKFHLLHMNNTKNKWYKTSTTEDISTKAFQDISLRDNDWVIVLSMKDKDIKGLGLVRDGAEFTTKFSTTGNYVPPTQFETRLVLGVSDGIKPRAPFNRADYYISKDGEVPSKCAPGTGVLVKAIMQHANGGLGRAIPLMDCVADFQAVFALDKDGDGDIDETTDSLAGKTAAEIRLQVKEVKLYILTHEGQMDPKYDFSQTTTPASSKIWVGENGLGREFDLNANFDNQTQIGTRWKWFRWRVLRVSEKPTALEG